MGLTISKVYFQGLNMDLLTPGGPWRCPWYPKGLISSPLPFFSPPDIYYLTHITAPLVSQLSPLPSLTTLYRLTTMPLVFYNPLTILL